MRITSVADVFVIIFILCCAVIPVSGAEQITLKIAYDHSDSYPWTLENGSGIDFYHMNMVAKNLNYKIEYVPYPWKRCLHTLKNNRVDGVMVGSFKEERMKMGVFPMKNGTHDPDKRMHSSSYSLYVLKDSPLSFDGQKLVNLTGDIGIPLGYSIGEKLTNLGAKVTEFECMGRLFFTLAKGHLQGAVTLTSIGDHAIGRTPGLASKIKRIAAPLAEKPYYLILSHKLWNEQPELCRKLWEEVKKVRKSAEYQKAYNDFLGK
ncbi:MAG: amino acid ABC transporter substrate-binding protein [Desulfobacteraceae bacterium]|nr:amino acid ABC transporter substrate-binding protein [Desulfobacteraceae bacterium]